ncbi:hypothetical protein LJB81_04500 [Desulfovibrio sp. OttesenSCG-928-M14]|nr:hypothetical protein [Desulfovibrio sp. OttesenSCG-928-M14]
MQSFEMNDEDFGMVDDYELTFGDDVDIDERLLASFKKTARELGIPRSKAQKLADMYAERVAESILESDAAMDEAKKHWEAEITARPGFKQELHAAQRVLKECGNDELPELLRQSLLGSHPSFFDFMVKVAGKINATGGGGATTPSRQRGASLAERMWPDKPVVKVRSGGRTTADRMWPDMG